uniref:Neur_chan_LBD domain-containing protein n=1 Tax=Panagrellus redivivus TaxID=6233 RepID=A0A7E4VBJ3_PANRE
MLSHTITTTLLYFTFITSSFAAETPTPTPSKKPVSKSSTSLPPTTASPDYGNGWTDKQIIEALLKRYRFPDPSVNISVSVLLEVEEILPSIDDKCHLIVGITQKWLEYSLEFKGLRDSLNPVRFRTLNYIWHPALIIDNAISQHIVGKDSLKVYASGLVEYNHRLKIVVPSEHNLKAFPFESRNCTIRFSNDDSRAVWGRLLRVTLPSTIEGASDWTAVPSETASNYHNLRLRLRRSITPWLYTYFLPTLAFVIASWVAVWMNSKATIARTAVSGVCFIATLLLVLHRTSSTPTTAYLKAIDYWNIAVCGFTFISFLQATLVASQASLGRRNPRTGKYIDDDEKSPWITETPYYSQLPTPSNISIIRICDWICRLAAPICFAIFVGLFVFFFVLPYGNVSA